ncbi:MAG: SxtJ family membrane protein [Thiotrichaceae bacterium]
MSIIPEVPDASKEELRKFGLIMGAAFILIFGLLFPWIFNKSLPLWPWIVAVVFIAWALIHPTSLKPVYIVWMKIGGVVGFINTRIILGLLFFLVFLPTGILLKLFGKELIPNKFSDEKSYRITTEAPSKDHVERPY